MPEVSRFYGIVIQMFYDDHNPPHFHASYGENKAVIKIRDLSIWQGSLPSKAMGMVIEWGTLHKDELLRNSEAIEEDEPINKIKPL